jgi:polysaccharide pyruvyl transferase WcaK-like protein
VEVTDFTRNGQDTKTRHRVERVVEVRNLTRTEITPEIERLDLFILGGGGIFFDKEVDVFLRDLEIAYQKHVPSRVYAVGVGPLNSETSRKRVQEVLSNVDIITVREREAKRIFEDIGVQHDIKVTADPAFLLTPEPLPKHALELEQVHGQRRIVGISVREPGPAAPDIDPNFYHGLLANAADFIISRLEADVIFVPMERQAQLSHAVISKMLSPQHAWVLKGEYPAGQLLTFMKNFSFTVGMRLHFLIFFALQGVPFVALPYATKVSGLLDDLQAPMPPLNRVDSGFVNAFIDKAWDDREQTKTRIQQLLPKLQSLAAENNRLAVELLTGDAHRSKRLLRKWRNKNMPVVKRAVGEITLPTRTAKLIPQTDVLVVGGGPAGIGAAMGAAQAGAHVVLVERYGFLGGNATAGLVLTLASYYTNPKISEIEKAHGPLLFPRDHGVGKPVIAGVLAQLVKRLVDAGGALEPSPQTGFLVPFDPEVFKTVALDMLDGANVDLLFNAFSSGVTTDADGVRGAIFETKSGPVVVKAKVIVDCTGDGDVAASAGAPFEVGHEKNGLVQPMTLMFLMSGFIRENFERYVKENPDQWNGVFGLTKLMNQAIAKGELNVPRENILLFGTVHENEVTVNSTRITNASGIDAWDLTRAELEGRRQVSQLTAFLRGYVPGFEKAFLAQSAVSASVRETRRILGEYKLTSSDVLEAKKFGDPIAHGTYPIDLHNPKGKGTVLKPVKPGYAYDIPLRCLIPLKVEDMIVAGRCISGTHKALASYRVMPICMATGQATGVCAAIANRKSQTPRRTSAKDVQEELVRQGAYLEIPKIGG